jgi:hypothetical protein
VNSEEKEFLLSRLNGLKRTLEEEQQQGYDKAVLISRLNEIKEFLEQEVELGPALTEDTPFAIPLDLRKVE